MIRSLLTSLFFAALLVLGWGSSDYFADAPRALIAVSVAVSPLFVSRISVSATKRGKDVAESPIVFWALAVMSILGIPFFFPFFSRHGILEIHVAQGLRYLGLFCYVTGYVVRTVATRTLKKQYSFYVTIQENHQLITSGIYSWIRHPVYLGTILGAGGLFLVFPTYYSLAILVLYTFLLRNRMSLEEKLLLKHFGSVFEEYSSKSFRLIPHIY